MTSLANGVNEEPPWIGVAGPIGGLGLLALSSALSWRSAASQRAKRHRVAAASKFTPEGPDATQDLAES